MNIIRLTHENIEREHICCAISAGDEQYVAAKKAWLDERLDEGLEFVKFDVRGKCFIEYIPAEFAWSPIAADGYMYINCLWVAGKFKGQGLSTQLLDFCAADARARGKIGLAALSSPKKLGFLADPKYLRHKGFRLADTAAPHFELMYLPFEADAPAPRFDINPSPAKRGVTIFYTDQCPYALKYAPVLEKIALERGFEARAERISTREEARRAAVPFTSFSIFDGEKFLTHEVLSEPKFNKLLDSLAQGGGV